jgi:hypothetical protein
MKAFNKSIAVLMVFAFSLITTGPAFACADHMAPAKAVSGSSEHSDHHANHENTDIASPCPAHSSGDHMDCLDSCGCHDAPMVTVPARSGDVKQVALLNKPSFSLPKTLTISHVREMFQRYLMQQGPPSLTVSAYKAHLAITTRQLT